MVFLFKLKKSTYYLLILLIKSKIKSKSKKNTLEKKKSKIIKVEKKLQDSKNLPLKKNTKNDETMLFVKNKNENFFQKENIPKTEKNISIPNLSKKPPIVRKKIEKKKENIVEENIEKIIEFSKNNSPSKNLLELNTFKNLNEISEIKDKTKINDTANFSNFITKTEEDSFLSKESKSNNFQITFGNCNKKTTSFLKKNVSYTKSKKNDNSIIVIELFFFIFK